MRRLFQFWRNLKRRNQILLGLLTAFLFLFIFFAASVEGVHYTESTEFCSSCHTVMEPEIETHAISAHANVDCGSCHIGSGIQHQLYYKVTAVRYLWTLPLQLYDRPLASARSTMRTTTEICENCHSTDLLHPSKLMVENRYGLDDDNTLTQLLLAMKVEQSGDELAARSTGAHWHVNNPVYFVSPDEFRQEIPWVQIEKDGQRVEYIDAGADPAAWQNAEAEKVQMDCIDCHSREGHSVKRPDRAIDAAMSHGFIPADLPAVKAQGVAVLDQRYASDEEALGAIAATIGDYYNTAHADIAASRQADIEQTISQLQRIYQETQFPHMNVYWDTYPENTGHLDFPGCFRCHDGAHLSEGGEAIPAECNLCHAMPQVVKPDVPVQLANRSISEAPESHQSSFWLAQHRFEFDATCDDCHTVNNPGGSDNSSTCSNSACHATDWKYLDINSPAVLAIAAPQRQEQARRLPDIPHPLAEVMQCELCHGLEKQFAYPDDHADYTNAECTNCHELSAEVLADSSPTPPAPTPTTTAIPPIVHALEGNENCLECHAVGGNIAPAPVTHNNFANADCGDCHRLAPDFVPLPNLQPTPTPELDTPTPAPTATSTPLPPTEAAPTEEPEAEPVAATPESSVTETPAAETEQSESEPAADSALQIVSHPLAGNDDCVACHAVDSDISPARPDHQAYTNDTCLACHFADDGGQ
ncbi:MAG: NapC/NirT family cytochrome c [Caldilineaceae bacterium]